MTLFTFKRYTLHCLLILVLSGCQKPTDDSNRSEQVRQKAEDFFQTFAERSDWRKFCSFYADDLVFNDIMLQLHLDSLWKFQRFYNWEDSVNVFEKLSPDDEILVVRSLVNDESSAVASGYFKPFYYNGQFFENKWGMEFTIWLYFDKDLKVIRQVDWIEYDDYTLESTIARYRKQGIEKTPDWLNLEK